MPEALAQWRKTLELNSSFVLALSQTAHALAASPVATDRNGAEAVKLAERAVVLSKGEEPLYLGALAMAYAEEGRCTEAVEVARRALQLAKEKNNSSLADSLREQVEVYQSRQPYRDDLQGSQ